MTSSCEVCGHTTQPLPLGPSDVLDLCPRCRHVHRDLARCPAAARASAWGGDSRLDAVRLRLTHQALLRRLARPPGSVYEAGYGDGRLLALFAAGGARVAGTDPGLLGRPVHPLPGADLASVALEVDAARREDRYDLVCAVHVIEHVPDPRTFLAAASRLARPGGVVAIVTPAGDSAQLSAFGRDWWMLEDPTHRRFFSADSLARLLGQAGLTEVTLSRPWLDSLSTESASLLRRLRRGRQAHEGTATGLLAAAGTLPALAIRAWPSWRPSLLATARAPM